METSVQPHCKACALKLLGRASENNRKDNGVWAGRSEQVTRVNGEMIAHSLPNSKGSYEGQVQVQVQALCLKCYISRRW